MERAWGLERLPGCDWTSSRDPLGAGDGVVLYRMRLRERSQRAHAPNLRDGTRGFELILQDKIKRLVQRYIRNAVYTYCM